MNDQARKLRELAQKIREERDRASIIFDPLARKPEKVSMNYGPAPRIKEPSFNTVPAIKEVQQAKPNPVITEEEKSAAKILLEEIRPTISPSPQTSKARVITISSGKGGVGKSNLVANLGIALSMRGRRVVILDADLGLANIDVLFGINPRYNLKHLVDGDKSMQEIVVKGPHRLKIVPGGSGIPELANLDDDQQQKLLESFVELEQDADIILIDTGAGISKDIISFILAAREALIITTPEPTAITDAYGLIKVLTQRDMDVDIKLIVNMVSTEKEGQDIANRIEMATRQFLNKRVETLGYITTDPSVNMSVRKQKPVILGYPNANASKCIKDIATILDKTSENDKKIASRNGLRGFFSRLLDR